MHEIKKMDLYKKKFNNWICRFVGSEFSREILKQGAHGIFVDINLNKLKFKKNYN